MFSANWARALVFGISLMAVTAHADLAGAQKAYAAQDFVRAYEMFRELAELGQVTAQENLAAMYVDGEGVKRDNTLGYAWATIARENGSTNAAMQNIIDQLQPHLNDAAKARVAEAKALFGKAALETRLLPAPLKAGAASQAACRISRPVNPDDYYPAAAVREGISGSVLLDVSVAPDGHAHHPQVLYSMPEHVFDDAARAVATFNGYAPAKDGDKAVPCSIRFKVKFTSKNSKVDNAMDAAFEKSRAPAQAGDPVAQVFFGLLMLDRSKTGQGDGMPIDWFLKAAQYGNPAAQYLVGAELLGPSWRPDAEVAKGLIWLKLAAASGNADARFALANYHLARDPAATTDPVVFAWLEDAAKAGHRDATLALAALLAASPDATRRDPSRALTLLSGDLAPSFELDPVTFEIRAAAQAALGKFPLAQSGQKQGIREAARLGWDTAPLESKLASYEKSVAWTGNLITGEKQ